MEGGVLRKFWSTVDSELAAVRQMKAAKASKCVPPISDHHIAESTCKRYFVTIIQQDRARFGGTQDEMNTFIEETARDGSDENKELEAGNSTDGGENEGDITKD